MRPRIKEELTLLRGLYDNTDHVEEGGEDWFRLPTYAIPDGWQLDSKPLQNAPIAFLIKADYPGAVPYGFLMPEGITFGGIVPKDTGAPPKPVPFPGNWLHFSWTVEDWRATNNARQGANLVVWCRSFATRLRWGV